MTAPELRSVLFVGTFAILGTLIAAERQTRCTSSPCEFTLTLEFGRTMSLERLDDGTEPDDLHMTSPRCLRAGDISKSSGQTSEEGADDDCVQVDTTKTSSHIITGDGRRRNILLVNRLFPGPTLDVPEGAEVLVHVKNHLQTVSTSIHWHGLLMKETPWMDGASFVTQCPIPPGHTFTYRFVASPAGTHWYHPHMVNHRQDGLFGLFVVRPTLPSGQPLGRQGEPKALILSDWTSADSLSVRMPDLRFGVSGRFPEEISSLINGRGHQGNPAEAILATIALKPTRPASAAAAAAAAAADDDDDRIRCLNAASLVAYTVTVDGHRLRILAWDGSEIMPLVVDAFIIFPGERIDFVVIPIGSINDTPKGNATARPTGSFWIRAVPVAEDNIKSTGSSSPEEINGTKTDPLNAFAVLSYASDANHTIPSSLPQDCTEDRKCQIFNCYRPYAASKHKTCVPLEDIKSAESSESVTDASPAEEFTFNVAGMSIDDRRFVNPLSPFYHQDQPDVLRCDAHCPEKAGQGGECACTHVRRLPPNKLVQVILFNMEREMDEEDGSHCEEEHDFGHPMHIHGHHFFVVRQGFGQFDPQNGTMLGNTQDISCGSNGEGSGTCKRPSLVSGSTKKLHLQNPPLKDTIIVPPGGYVVLRFCTDNPGYWLMHCHLLDDQIEGMSMLLEVDPSGLGSAPKEHPRCNPHKTNPSIAEPHSAGVFQYMYRDDMTIGMTLNEFGGFRLSLTTPELVGLCIGCFIGGLLLAIVLRFIMDRGRCCQRGQESKQWQKNAVPTPSEAGNKNRPFKTHL